MKNRVKLVTFVDKVTCSKPDLSGAGGSAVQIRSFREAFLTARCLAGRDDIVGWRRS